MTYLPRACGPAFHRLLTQFPAVLVTGARQSGKTTFVRHETPGSPTYVSLDDPIERAFVRADPSAFLDRFPPGAPVVLDEVQHIPELFDYLKVRIDREREACGRWILTGSQRFALMRNVSESLAGRLGILELHPFGLLEHHPGTPEALREILWTGRYPEPALHPDRRDAWARAYLETYIERDVRSLLGIQHLRAFETFLAVCAARHGQEFHLAEVSRDCGVSIPTVKSWVGVLQASFVLALVPPHFENYGKRLVRAPKLVFLDPILPAELTRQPSGEALLAGSMGGAFFEGFLIAEAIKILASEGRRPDVFFWRTRDGTEVDLLVQTPRGILPVEAKLTASPSPRHQEPMRRFRTTAGGAAGPGALVCRVEEPMALPGGDVALPWDRFPEWLREAISGG
jgi:predicted AAA+ superfamily ATPase